MIDKTLSRAEAEEMFFQEAILFFGSDAVPEYRIYELFGEPAADFVMNNMKHEGYLIGGRDYNSCGACTEERPIIHYFYKEGFMKIVSEHNYLLSLIKHKSSDGGKISDEKWKFRGEEIKTEVKRRKKSK